MRMGRTTLFADAISLFRLSPTEPGRKYGNLQSCSEQAFPNANHLLTGAGNLGLCTFSARIVYWGHTGNDFGIGRQTSRFPNLIAAEQRLIASFPCRAQDNDITFLLTSFSR